MRARARAKLLRQEAGRLSAAAPIFEGPAVFTRTTDGGRSWERVKVIHDPGGNAQTINNIVVVPPSGKVIDFFTELDRFILIRFVRSSDKGDTFEEKARLAAGIFTNFGVVTPDSKTLVRDASILFDVTTDPRNGNLYLVWQDTRFNGIDKIAFSQSKDGGDSWSEPVPINQTPRSPQNKLREQAFLPTIKVGADGRLVVTYYDFRKDDNRTGAELTDHFAVRCDAGKVDCRDASSWGDELRLTPFSFDYLQAPEARGLFLGDYMGLAASRGAALPVFGIPDGYNRTSLFTRPILSRSGSVAATAP